MTKEKQRIAIAKACGWECAGKCRCGCDTDIWQNHSESFSCLPDYLNDLNAMHEAEKVLTLDQLQSYVGRLATWNLSEPNPHNPWLFIHCAMAPAHVRVEAFLRTLDLWEEEESPE